MLCNESNFCKTLAFWLSKSSPYSICWKPSVETSYNAFMCKSCVSIKKNVFTRGFGWFSGEDETRFMCCLN
jgi:hypothetical protein